MLIVIYVSNRGFPTFNPEGAEGVGAIIEVQDDAEFASNEDGRTLIRLKGYRNFYDADWLLDISAEPLEQERSRRVPFLRHPDQPEDPFA